jgi:hypothetical protein
MLNSDKGEVGQRSMGLLPEGPPPQNNTDQEGDKCHDQAEAETQDHNHSESKIGLLRRRRPIQNREQPQPHERIAAPRSKENLTRESH